MTNTIDGQPSYAPGWYADVNVPGSERWFDGATWTEHVRPAETQEAPTVTDAGGYAAASTGLAATKQPWFKRKPIIIPVAIVGGIIVLSAIGGAIGGGGNNDTVADTPTTSQAPKVAKVADEEIVPVLVDVPSVVGMTGSEAQATLSALGFKVDVGGGDLSMPVTAQDVTVGAQAEEGSTVKLTLQEKPKLTLAQQNALRSAEQYLDFMPFSRAGLLQQLTSEYGSGYAAEDAEFAVATLEQTGKVDWNAEAAEAAQSYLDLMSFSRDGLFEQLTSSYGAGFTAEQANVGLAAVGY